MRVFLDSCVILSRIPRELFLQAAKSDLLELCYSPSVEAESMHVAERKGMEADIAASFVEFALYAQKAPEAEDRPSLWLPDENDRHVVLGALGAKADVIATENLRDFPRAALEPLGLRAQSPDQILFPLQNSLMLGNYEKSKLKAAKLYRLAKF